ncbi:MAG: ribosome biogenesis GTPase Der [Spirochaetes bacterium]|nr:ribosome biogenesis GTPase Der [Spirochaetota bacterium]
MKETRRPGKPAVRTKTSRSPGAAKENPARERGGPRKTPADREKTAAARNKAAKPVASRPEGGKMGRKKASIEAAASSMATVAPEADDVPKGRTRYRNLPVVAVVGRPNVGKSTLFNRILRHRKAITDPTPGVTRDPIETVCFLPDSGKRILLVDTGGYKVDREEIDELVAERSLRTVDKADLVLFIVDVTVITPEDEEFAARLRKVADRVLLVVNKADSPERDPRGWDFARFGFSDIIFTSAAHGRNLAELEEKIVERLDFSRVEEYEDLHEDVRIAFLGKPNTGKSTLLNRLLGEEKSIVSPIPGTTRDVVEGSFAWKERRFTALDTAGIRRKKKVHDDVEYYSVNRAIRTIDECDVVVLMIDAVEGLTDQDKKIAALAVEKGRGVIFALNKWDTMPDIKNGFEAASDRLRYFFGQMAYAPILPLSARRGTGLGKLLDTAARLFDQLNRKIDTGKLNRALESWLESYPTPIGGRTRFKIRYMTQSGLNPVKFVLFATRPEVVPDSYKSYLKNKIRSDLGFDLVPVELDFRASRRDYRDL